MARAQNSSAIDALLASETGIENAAKRKEPLSRYTPRETPALQGLEPVSDTPEADALSYLGNGPESDHPLDLDQDAQPHGTTQGSDDRKIGTHRGTRTREVSARDDHNAMRAVDHARRILRALNAMLTLNLPAIRDAAPEDRAGLWRVERDAIRVFFNDHGDTFTGIWNRSSMDREGRGEHLHMLFHLPKVLRRKFLALMKRRWGGEPAATLRDATTTWWAKKSGRMQSAQNYVLQGVGWCRAMNQGREWKPGGSITGKRTGWSGDIGPASVAKWEVAHGIVTR